MPHTPAAALRHLARSIAVVALGVLVLGVATLGQVPAPVGLAAMAAGDPVTFTGHGYGHGRGMGQYGAYGYARSGWSHEQLLARYYGNTVPTQQGNPVMTVRLVGQHNRAVDVFSDRGQLRLTLVGLGVGAEGVQTRVPEEVGDQDRVRPAAPELSGKSVPQGVGSEAAAGGGVRAEADVFTEVGDDGARGPVGQAPAAAVEQQRRRVLRVRPDGALVEPVAQGGAQLGPGQRQLPQLAAVAALAPDPQAAFAGREGHVGDVQADDLTDAQPGVEGQQCHHDVPGGTAVLHRPQIPGDVPGPDRLRRPPRQRLPTGGGRPETTAGVEVVERGEGVVDRRRLQPGRWSWPRPTSPAPPHPAPPDRSAVYFARDAAANGARASARW